MSHYQVIPHQLRPHYFFNGGEYLSSLLTLSSMKYDAILSIFHHNNVESMNPRPRTVGWQSGAVLDEGFDDYNSFNSAGWTSVHPAQQR